MTKFDPENVDGVPVICEKCGTATVKEGIEEAESVAENHNDIQHDSNDVAVAVVEEHDINIGEVPESKRRGFVRSILEMVR